MKKLFFLFLVVLFTFEVFCVEEKNVSGDVDISTGMRFLYSDTKIIFDNDDSEHSLITMVAAIEVKVDISRFLTIGLVAGYNWNHFKDPVVVSSLPLSLTLDNNTYNSMVFGINLRSNPFSFGDFMVEGKGEFLYFKRFKNEWDIELPIVTGIAEAKHSYFQTSIDLVLKYDGFMVFTPYIGPQIHFLNGKLTASETVEDIAAEAVIKHKQKNFIGLVGGLNIEFADNWDACLEITLFSKLSVTLSIFYLF